MVVANGSPEARTIDPGRYSDGITGHTSGVDILTGGRVDLREPFSLPAYGSMVIEL
jgi:hypothetical protein